ncbi:La-related protein 7 [Sarracenia purpurea var. burkii]
MEKGKSKIVSSGGFDGIRLVELGGTSNGGPLRQEDSVSKLDGTGRRFERVLGEARTENRWRDHHPRFSCSYASVVASRQGGGIRAEDGKKKSATPPDNTSGEKANHRTDDQSCTVFVDQLPETMHKDWLRRLFEPCGNITEVFIPLKRRQVSKSKYGFVRFREKVSVEKAIKKYNQVWCVNKKLRVKRAWARDNNKRSGYQGCPPSIYWKGNLDQECGSETRGIYPRGPKHVLPTVEAEAIDEEWLKNCAIGIVRYGMEVESIHEAMKSDGVYGIRVKALGENKALLMFADVEEKEAYLSSGGPDLGCPACVAAPWALLVVWMLI